MASGTSGSIDTQELNINKEILCDDDVSFIRTYILDADGEIISTNDFDLEGMPYTVVGTVQRCCDEVYVGEVCYSDVTTVSPSQFPWVIDSVSTAHKDIPGYGTILAQRTSGTHDFSSTAQCGGANQPNQLTIFKAPAPPGPSVVQFTFPSGSDPLSATIIDLDVGETFSSPSHGDADSIPAGIIQPGGPGTPYQGAVANTIATFTWSGNGSNIFSAAFQGACLAFDFAELNSTAQITIYRAKQFVDCHGETRYEDAETGDEIDVEFIDIFDCPCCKSFILCDDNGPFMRSVTTDRVYDTTLDGETDYTPVGTVRICSSADEDLQDLEIVPFCFFVNAQPGSLHHGYAVIHLEETTSTTLYYYEVDTGAVHLPAAVTPTACVRDDELLTLCDDNGTFLRRFIYGSFGNLITILDTQLDGSTPYVVVGTVQNCTVDSIQDSETEILCDSNSSFLRRYLYDNDGNLIGTLDTEEDGVTAHVATGLVRACYDRLFTVGCTPRHKELVGGVTWTPADVVAATPSSLTYTVLVNDPANAVNLNGIVINNIPAGYSASWSVEDTNSIFVPTLISAGPAGRIIVHWLECPGLP